MLDFHETINLLESHHNLYIVRIKRLADKVFNDYIKPYCIENRLSFVGGFNEPYFYNDIGRKVMDIDETIMSFLLLEVPETTTKLYTYMPKFKFSEVAPGK